MSKTAERMIPEPEVWEREARAYAQALLDQREVKHAAVDAYVMAEIGEALYFNPQRRAIFAAKITAYMEAYDRGWEDGQAHGYQNGIADGRMEATKEAGA